MYVETYRSFVLLRVLFEFCVVFIECTSPFDVVLSFLL